MIRRAGAALVMAIGLTACGGGSAPTSPAPQAPAGLFFDSAGARLSYQIDRPAGAGPFPGIVLGHERGMITKQQLAAMSAPLVQGGYAVMRYDKRGTGQSTGTFEDVTVANSETVISQLADDLVAAMQTMRQQAFVDPAHTGFAGVSEAAADGLQRALRL